MEVEEHKPTPSMVALQPEFPKGMAPKMLKLVKVLNDFESKMEPLISKQHHEVLNKLSPAERAKVGLMEVYTINSLFWILMKTSGENIDTTLRDDYKVEMGRLKEAQIKLAEIEIRAQRPPVDTRVAARFIHQGLGIGQRRDIQDVELEQGYVRQERGQSWNSHAHHGCQEDSAMEYENNDDHDYSESQKVIKKRIEVSSKNSTDNAVPEFSSEGKLLKKKKIKKNSKEANGTLKKKKKKAECAPGSVADLKVLQMAETEKVETGEEHNTLKIDTVKGKKKKPLASMKGKKKRKVRENGNDHIEENQHVNEEDGKVPSSVSNKKKKKKTKVEKSVNEADITAFLDTTRGGINYEIEDNQDLHYKGRSWYEQGWT